MPVMDEFKEEREALKNGTFKEKVAYFVEYYKWHTLAVVAAIAFVVSLGYHYLTQKDTAFYAAMVNGMELPDAQEYLLSFAEYVGIDLDSCEVLLDASMQIDLEALDQTTYASSQKLLAYITGKEVDVLVTDEQVMDNYAYGDTFHDLRAFLTAEQYEKYEPWFYYIDQAVMDEEKASHSALESTASPEHPDPRKPEAMRDPVPVGIYLDKATALREAFYYEEEEIIAAVVGNTQRGETASQFLDFILQGE